jgi:hypothetical protein
MPESVAGCLAPPRIGRHGLRRVRVGAVDQDQRAGVGDARRIRHAADCERERGKSVEGVHEGTGGKEFVVLNACMPDSVDPRGPKGR